MSLLPLDSLRKVLWRNIPASRRARRFVSATLRAKGQGEITDLLASIREKCSIYMQQFGAAFLTMRQTGECRQSVEEFFHRFRRYANRRRITFHDGGSLQTEIRLFVARPVT